MVWPDLAKMFVIGCVCMHELYEMYARARPVRLAGFIALAGLLAFALVAGPWVAPQGGGRACPGGS